MIYSCHDQYNIPPLIASFFRIGRSVVSKPLSPKDVEVTVQGNTRSVSFKLEEKVWSSKNVRLSTLFSYFLLVGPIYINSHVLFSLLWRTIILWLLCDRSSFLWTLLSTSTTDFQQRRRARMRWANLLHYHGWNAGANIRVVIHQITWLHHIGICILQEECDYWQKGWFSSLPCSDMPLNIQLPIHVHLSVTTLMCP